MSVTFTQRFRVDIFHRCRATRDLVNVQKRVCSICVTFDLVERRESALNVVRETNIPPRKRSGRPTTMRGYAAKTCARRRPRTCSRRTASRMTVDIYRRKKEIKALPIDSSAGQNCRPAILFDRYARRLRETIYFEGPVLRADDVFGICTVQRWFFDKTFPSQ